MNGDQVRLSVPAKPEYILAVRLAVSAVAERAGFSIDDIEDLKAASAEACILLLAVCPKQIDICVTVEDGLRVALDAAGEGDPNQKNAADEGDGLSQYLLEALVDECAFSNQGEDIRHITFYKKLQ